ncbi:Cof-type HAD-IIB family hydrolase [Streptomyces xiaopingdaonensis]|uniref:Cof-type HAD-IIB family hydrolase n=1 Tax=Streptomyces xiaopingdaonensis TaxID=1565415 RepID=UPI000314292F|nr:Cof-type HAD-IIB family hydrolase [Streptomyces xiaopingdaonensis]
MTATSSEFPYSLIATDLDGTLLRGDDTVSARTRDALAEAGKGGATHLVVTGRAVPWTRQVFDVLGYEGLAVCGQGGQVYDAGARRMITSVTLDRDLARRAVARIEAEVGPLLLAASRDGVDGEVVVAPGYAVQEGPLPHVPSTDPEVLWAEPLNKLYLQHPSLGDDELASAARRLAGDLVSVTMAGAGVVELLPSGLSKARGLSLVARRLGVRKQETLAFGDMPNDVPLLSWAGHGVAMANAHPELLAVCDEVTASNEEDGIALVLERLLDG